MSDRAARRRAERETTWAPHEQGEHQTLNPGRSLARHTRDCPRCSTGSVATKGCEWVAEFSAKNPEFVTALLGMQSEVTE